MIKGKRVMPRKYYELERDYSAARTLKEKLRILEEMLETIPLKAMEFNKARSHITHKMRLIKEKLKKEEKRLIREASNQKFFKQDKFTIALIGEANSGKTKLLNNLCKTSYESTITPYETKKVLISEMKHNKATIRVIEIPSAIKRVHAKILKESNLIVVMPQSDYYKQFLNEHMINTPAISLKTMPANNWSFLNLITITIKGQPLVTYKGTTLSDLNLTKAIVNGQEQTSNYELKEEDEIN